MDVGLLSDIVRHCPTLSEVTVKLALLVRLKLISRPEVRLPISSGRTHGGMDQIAMTTPASCQDKSGCQNCLGLTSDGDGLASLESIVTI